MPKHGSPNTNIPGAQDYLHVPDALADIIEQAINRDADLLADILDGKDKPTPLLDDILAGGSAVGGGKRNPFIPPVVQNLIKTGSIIAAGLDQPNAPFQSTGGWVFDRVCALQNHLSWGRQSTVYDADTCRGPFGYPTGGPMPEGPVAWGYYPAWSFPRANFKYLSHEQARVASTDVSFIETVNRYINPNFPNFAGPGVGVGASMGFEPNPNDPRNISRPIPPRRGQRHVPLPTEKTLPASRPRLVPPPIQNTTVFTQEPGKQPQVQPKPRPQVQPHWPRPPRVQTIERERKVVHWGVKVWKLVDLVSEAAEVVDAFYEALPKEIRKKWEKKYGGYWTKGDDGKYKWVLPHRGLADQAGQYGIDYADMKLQALWFNWDKVDIGDALANVAYNEIEDKIIGNIERHLPKNTGVVDHGAFEAYGQVAGDWKNAFKDAVLNRN